MTWISAGAGPGRVGEVAREGWRPRRGAARPGGPPVRAAGAPAAVRGAGPRRQAARALAPPPPGALKHPTVLSQSIDVEH